MQLDFIHFLKEELNPWNTYLIRLLFSFHSFEKLSLYVEIRWQFILLNVYPALRLVDYRFSFSFGFTPSIIHPFSKPAQSHTRLLEPFLTTVEPFISASGGHWLPFTPKGRICSLQVTYHSACFCSLIVNPFANLFFNVSSKSSANLIVNAFNIFIYFNSISVLGMNFDHKKPPWMLKAKTWLWFAEKKAGPFSCWFKGKPWLPMACGVTPTSVAPESDVDPPNWKMCQRFTSIIEITTSSLQIGI